MNTAFSEKSHSNPDFESKIASFDEFATKGEISNHIDCQTSTETPPLRILGEKRAGKNDLVCHFYPCMKAFKSRENLDLHILNIHLKIKPFTCDFCEKKFSHRNGKDLFNEREELSRTDEAP